MRDSFDAREHRSRQKRRPSCWLFALLLVLVLVVSWGVRAQSLHQWLAEPETHFSKGVPGSGSDSYYWFRLARELRDRDFEAGDRDRLRAWPEGLQRGPRPAYPWLIAATSRLFASDVYRTALVLNVFLSSLFIVPLAFYGLRIGYPIAGLFAGYVGSLAPVYLHRSSVHRVDTDGGTLFFLCLLALGIASLRPNATLRQNGFVAASTGLCLALFCRWYGQPGFWLVYAATLGLHLLANRFARRDAVRLGLIFAVCANPLLAWPGIAGIAHFARYYVFASPSAPPNPLDYANVTLDISELQPLALVETLTRIVDLPAVAGLGLAGFAAFLVLRWRTAVPLLPMVMLGLYSLVGPQRFGMYLAPLVGLGCGFLLDTAAAKWQGASASGRSLAEPAAHAAAVAGAALLLGHTGFAFEPKPTIPVPLVSSLQGLAEKLPPRPAILASWGSGYLIADVTGAATLNDGEAPDPLVHYLFARAITSRDPTELVRIVAVLSTYGRRDLHAALDDQPDPKEAIDALLQRKAHTDGNVVVLITERDMLPFPSFMRTGLFDFARGIGPEEPYYSAECERVDARRLDCRKPDQTKFRVDLAKGRIDGDTRLRRVVEIHGGRVRHETEHAPGASLSLQLIPRDESGTYAAQLVREAVFQSNFNQLFILGRYDPTQLEEIHRDLPLMRAFRIRASD